MKGRIDEDYTIVEPEYSYSWTLTPADTRATGARRPFFSSVELRHIGLAVAVLIVALTLVFWDFSPSTLPFFLGLAAAAVVLGFFGHEMAHKAVARRYGCWAEFRANIRGLCIALLLSLFGILFAAPGAVHISGNISRVDNGKISIAGPGVNLLIAGACMPFVISGPLWATGSLYDLLFMLYFFNAFLALFNLLPVPPLDGSKIWRWNLPLYIFAMAAAVLMLAFAWL